MEVMPQKEDSAPRPSPEFSCDSPALMLLFPPAASASPDVLSAGNAGLFLPFWIHSLDYLFQQSH